MRIGDNAEVVTSSYATAAFEAIVSDGGVGDIEVKLRRELALQLPLRRIAKLEASLQFAQRHTTGSCAAARLFALSQ